MFRNVKYETSVPIVASDMTIHRTFMDTTGRTVLQLTAVNLVDELRDRELIVSEAFNHHEILTITKSKANNTFVRR